MQVLVSKIAGSNISVFTLTLTVAYYEVVPVLGVVTSRLATGLRVMQILYLSLPAMPCILVYAHMYMYMLSLIKVFLVAFTKF